MPAIPSSAPPTPLSADDTLPFRFIGGNAGFDLVNTVDWREEDGPANERLTSYERLIEWARQGGLIDGAEAAHRLRRASARPAEARAAYDRALSLRWALQRLLTALARDGSNAAAAREPLAALNQFVAEAYSHLRLGLGVGHSRGSRGAAWEWAGAPDRLDAILWPVVRSVAELLVSDEVPRVRVCAGEDCGWVYVDRSRNGLRRWCEMATCGTTAKSRRRRGKANA